MPKAAPKKICWGIFDQFSGRILSSQFDINLISHSDELHLKMESIGDCRPRLMQFLL